MTKIEKLHNLLVAHFGHSVKEVEDEIVKLFKAKDEVTYNDQNEAMINEVTLAFINKIHPIRAMTSKTKANIYNRLQTFNVAECIRAIENFSKDEWNMKNNGHRSLEWFFQNDIRIETYMNMVPKRADGSDEEVIKVGTKTYKNEEELLAAEKRGEIWYDDRKAKFIPAGEAS